MRGGWWRTWICGCAAACGCCECVVSLLGKAQLGPVLDVLGLLLLVLGLALGFAIVHVLLGVAVGLGAGGAGCMLLARAAER